MAGRRQGETRRTRHDPLAKVGAMDAKDAGLTRQLLDDERLATAARAFVVAILEASGANLGAGGVGLSRDATENLAHGLVRAALDPRKLKRRVEAINPRRFELLDRDVMAGDLSPKEKAELKRLEAEVTTLVALLTTPRKL